MKCNGGVVVLCSCYSELFCGFKLQKWVSVTSIATPLPQRLSSYIIMSEMDLVISFVVWSPLLIWALTTVITLFEGDTARDLVHHLIKTPAPNDSARQPQITSYIAPAASTPAKTSHALHKIYDLMALWCFLMMSWFHVCDVVISHNLRS